MNATITYRGPARTTHPALGELAPDEPREIPERDVPAALEALAAGLPLEVTLPPGATLEVVLPEEEPPGDAEEHRPVFTVHASAQVEEE